MKKFLIASALLFSGLASAQIPYIPQPSVELVAGNSKFAFELYKKAGKDPDKNVFFSPFSISTALAMTYTGAKGETMVQMEKVLGFIEGPTFSNEYKVLLDAIQKNTSSLQFNLANRLFGDKLLKVLPAFKDNLASNFRAPIQQVDFLNNLEGCRKLINAWVETQTKNKIVELLKPGVLSDSTKLILVNAIYFYANWLHAFDPKLTKEEDFTKNDKSKFKVKMMRQETNFAYYENEKFQAIQLPYVGNKIQMTVFLPNPNSGISDFESDFGYDVFSKCIPLFRPQPVTLSFPKFKITEEMMLGETLKQMGMPLAFSDQADFSGITGKKDLKIDKVIHKAFIEVSEKGTEAAAATAVVMNTTESVHLPPVPKVFRADRPFFFMIRDSISGTILFMGRVNNPT